MKVSSVILATMLFLCFRMASNVFAADVNGVWTKTTSEDPNNVAIFYPQKNDQKAIGYSQVHGRRVVWYAVGEIKGSILHCYYHHSLDTIPPGWEQGIMRLALSQDGNVITGTAKSTSGNWCCLI